VSGVALSLALGIAISAISSLPLLVPIAVATAIVCRAYGVRGAGGWIAAFVVIAMATGLAGILIGFVFLSVAGR
jgi:ABC-type sulfate transport system permease component